jgi:pimeloyl-ACP methyl ester carboxylesterase
VVKKILRAVIPAIFLIALYLMMNSYVRSMTYPAPSIPVPSIAPKPFKDIWIQTASGTKVHAWHFQTPESHAPVMIYFHGNGENLETLQMSGLLDALLLLNISILAVDYPGYGRSEGKPSEVNIRQAATAAARWAKEKHPDSDLISCGWSLGASVAIDVAARHPEIFHGLIAMSAWSSLHDVARKHFPAWMVGMLLQESYDSVNAAARIKCPVLFIHGEVDSLIPAEQGKAVFDALQVQKSFALLPGISHNDLFDSPRVWQEITSFIKTVTTPA